MNSTAIEGTKPDRWHANISAVVVCVMLTLLAACDQRRAPAESDDSVAAQVTVVSLKARPVTLTQSLTGRVRASLVAEVRPRVTGVVSRLLFTEGGYVSTGQPLYQLDDTLYCAKAQRASAGLQKAQAALKAAQQSASRTADLAGIGMLSLQANESAVSALAQAQAEFDVSRAELAMANATLAFTQIKAPISGRIGKSAVTQGALVTSEQVAPLTTIQRLDPAYVELSQPSKAWVTSRRSIDTGRLSVGGAALTARILLEDGTRYSHDGKMQFSDVTVDPATGNLLVRLVVANPNLLLLPGMYVHSVVDEGVLAQAVLAPQQAISRDPRGNATAKVVGEDNRVELRSVRTSRAIDDQWLIDEGLIAGDRVIVEGLQKAIPGALVRPVERAAIAPTGDIVSASRSNAQTGIGGANR